MQDIINTNEKEKMLTAEDNQAITVEKDMNKKLEKVNGLDENNNEIDNVNKEIKEVKEEIKEVEEEISVQKKVLKEKDSQDMVSGNAEDITIPPPPEFSVPLFSKYLHGRQRSISISSEFSNDSFVSEDININGTNTMDSPNISAMDSSSESLVNTEIGMLESDSIDSINEKISMTSLNITTPTTNDNTKKEEETQNEIEDLTQKLKVEIPPTSPTPSGHHVPPPRNTSSLSASVHRKEGTEDEDSLQNDPITIVDSIKISDNCSMKKVQSPKAEADNQSNKKETRKRAKSFKEYFFSSLSTNGSNSNASNSTTSNSINEQESQKVNTTSSTTSSNGNSSTATTSSLMSFVGSLQSKFIGKKQIVYFNTDEEFWEAFLREYRKELPLDGSSINVDGTNKFNDLLERVQRGVPAKHRGVIWLNISDSLDAHLDVLYWQLLNEHCPYERAINQDLGRTFPEIPMFKKEHVRQSLFNIMKAYSIYDSEVGYCQGLSFIAGIFLMQNMKEELAFTIFVRLMESYNLRTLFTPKMPGLMLLIFQFNAIFQTYIPALYFHFYRYNLSPMMYASQWFLTLFSYSFNVEMVFRIIDLILVEGPISVLIRFALAVLKYNEDRLLSIEKFDSLMDYLKSPKFTYIPDVEEMMQNIIGLSSIVNENRLEQLKLEHLEDIKRREPANREMEQLRETIKLLRKENREQNIKIVEDKKIQQALTDEISLLKRLVKELQEDNEAVKMQVKDLRIILSREESSGRRDDKIDSLEEEVQFIKDKLRATQVELCQARMQYNELETAHQLEQERWKKSKRRLSRKIQLTEDKYKRTSHIIDPPATPTSMKPIDIDLGAINE